VTPQGQADGRDVNKVQPRREMPMANGAFRRLEGWRANSAAQSRKNLREYHLYTLEHATTLHDRETKQWICPRGGISSQDGPMFTTDLKLDQNYRGWTFEPISGSRRVRPSLQSKSLGDGRIHRRTRIIWVALPKGEYGSIAVTTMDSSIHWPRTI